MNRCSGCGAPLQSENKEEKGFIPLEKSQAKICERCFKLTHYNELREEQVMENEEIIKKVNQAKHFVFFLCDFLNLNEEVIKIYKEIKNKKCFLISKTDYIPKSLKKEKILLWLKKIYKIEEEIYFISAKNRQNIHVLNKVLEKQNESIALMVGFTNAGKSTLLNALQKESSITTSYYPNTTLDFFKIPIEDKMYMDTPGLQNRVFNLSLYKKLTPKNPIKPITYQLKKKASVLIEDLFRLENESAKTNCTFYVSNALTIKKVYENNPVLKEEKQKHFQIKKNQDLVLHGIGFVNFKTDSIVTIYTSFLENISLRESMFGDKNE